LQASGFRWDATVFRLNARPRPKIGSEPAFRRDTAERVYTFEAAYNPEVAGSKSCPRYFERRWKRRLSLLPARSPILVESVRTPVHA
jgi:hypothetical protein